MDGLNYHHLQYFHAVVEEGGIAAASRRLHVGRPAISAQVKSLEAFLGAALFQRRGRHLDLTETGKLVHGYTSEIFATGRELLDAVRGGAGVGSRVFRVGIADVMPKLVAFQILQPAFELGDDLVLECREDAPRRLFAELAVHELDLVLSDIPLGPGLDVRAYNHACGESTTTLFAAPALAERLSGEFPRSLDGAPLLIPSRESAIRRALEDWLDAEDVRPRIVGEFADSALLKVFGQAGRGVFPAPTVVAPDVVAHYGARPLGELETVRDRYFAISPERRIKHPAVALLVERAQAGLFG